MRAELGLGDRLGGTCRVGEEIQQVEKVGLETQVMEEQELSRDP